MSSSEKEFGKYDFDTTLAFFKYTKENPTEIRNGETRGDWFTRCHGITGAEFAKIAKARLAERARNKKMTEK